MGYEPSDIEILQMEDKEHLNFHASRWMLSLPCRGVIYAWTIKENCFVHMERVQRPVDTFYDHSFIFHGQFSLWIPRSCAGVITTLQTNRTMPKATKDRKTIKIRAQGCGGIHEKGSIVFFCSASLLFLEQRRIRAARLPQLALALFQGWENVKLCFFYVHGDKKITKKQDNYLVFFFWLKYAFQF